MIIPHKGKLANVIFTTMNGDLEIQHAVYKDTGKELTDEEIQDLLNENADTLWLCALEIQNKYDLEQWYG